jgi:hypothetical protein
MAGSYAATRLVFAPPLTFIPVICEFLGQVTDTGRRFYHFVGTGAVPVCRISETAARLNYEHTLRHQIRKVCVRRTQRYFDNVSVGSHRNDIHHQAYRL